MARYLARRCPRCDGYLGVVVWGRLPKSTAQSVNGFCAVCSHQMAWKLIHGKRRGGVDFSGRIPKLFKPGRRDSAIEPRDN
jgi:hypothetical protein